MKRFFSLSFDKFCNFWEIFPNIYPLQLLRVANSVDLKLYFHSYVAYLYKTVELVDFFDTTI